MFSSLKLTKNLRLRNKQQQQIQQSQLDYSGTETSVGPPHLDLTNNVSSKPPMPVVTTSRRSHKWSIDKALCPGLGDKTSNGGNAKLALTCKAEEYGHVDYKENENAIVPADEWSQSNYDQEENVGVTCRLAHVCIERDANGSLGITLRGGIQSNPEHNSPLVITQVRPNGPADREGTIKVGDRLLCVDGRPLHSVTLSEAQTILRDSGGPVSTLTIEYNVSNMDHLRTSHGTLLVEVNTTRPHSLGLTLVSTRHNSLVIGHVKVGSIAERCGAFMPGDQILAVNGTRIEGTDMTANDVYNLLWHPKDCVLMIEVLAAPTNTLRGYTKNNWYTSSSPTLSSPGSSTIRDGPTFINHCKLPSHDTAVGGIVHTESMLVSLHANQDGNFGLMLQWSETQRSTVIACIETGGPAERCGCLRVGDRVLSVNDCSPPVCAEPRKLEQLLHGTSVILSVQFDIAQTVVPATGIFTVKLANNRNCGLGITITGCNHGMVISQIRAGSVAHRSGTLFPGDRILAVNNCNLDALSLDEAIDVLQSAPDIVTLTVQKEVQTESSVAFTVELARNGGPLGITIAGSEDCCEPIIISALTPGGLAERTRTLQIGDQLLAIDGHSVEKQPLSRAIGLLQHSGENVILNVTRASHRLGPGYSSPGLPSVDSAVESWDSSQSPSVNQSTPPFYKSDDPYKGNQTAAICNWQTTEEALQQSSNSLNTVTIHSDAEDTCSSFRLSESVLSDLQAQLHANQKNGILPSPPCPLQVKYQHRNNTLPPLRRRSSTLGLHDSVDCIEIGGQDPHSMFQFSDQEALQGPLPLDSKSIPEITFNTFLNKNQTPPLTHDNSDSCLYGKDIFQVTLFKDPIYEDFGFSVSDGLYERGVFINRIRQGGPADNSRLLKPYDRILQVNDTRTQDFDCCLTVPLVAAAGDRVTLVISRPKTSLKEQADSLPWVEEEVDDASITMPEIHSQTITKTL